MLLCQTMKTINTFVVFGVVLTTVCAVPYSGPGCLYGEEEPEPERNNFLIRVLTVLSRIFNNDDRNRALYTDKHPIEQVGSSVIPQKKWRPYSRFVRIGRSADPEFLPQTEKRNYVRIGKIPSSAFIRFRDGAWPDTDAIGTSRRLNRNGVVRVG